MLGECQQIKKDHEFIVVLSSGGKACAYRADLKHNDHEVIVVVVSSGGRTCAQHADLKNKDHEFIMVLSSGGRT